MGLTSSARRVRAVVVGADNTGADNLAVDVLGVVGDNVAGTATAVGHLGSMDLGHFRIVLSCFVVGT